MPGEQRVALVTGANRGIGAEIARQLAAEEDGIRSNSICPVWLATDPEAGSGGFYRDRAPIPW